MLIILKEWLEGSFILIVRDSQNSVTRVCNLEIVNSVSYYLFFIMRSTKHPSNITVLFNYRLEIFNIWVLLRGLDVSGDTKITVIFYQYHIVSKALWFSNLSDGVSYGYFFMISLLFLRTPLAVIGLCIWTAVFLKCIYRLWTWIIRKIALQLSLESPKNNS